MKRLALSLSLAVSLHGVLFFLGPMPVPRASLDSLPAPPVIVHLGLEPGGNPGEGVGSAAPPAEPAPEGPASVAEPASNVAPPPAPEQTAIDHPAPAPAPPPAAADRPFENKKVPIVHDQRKARKPPATARRDSRESATAEPETRAQVTHASAGDSAGSASGKETAGGPSPDSPGAGTDSSTRQAIPLYRYNPAPTYPALARSRGQQGTVLIEVEVSMTGSVIQLRLYRSSGHRALDQAALETVAHWRFLPGTRNGRPVAMWVRVPVHFSLDSMPRS